MAEIIHDAKRGYLIPPRKKRNGKKRITRRRPLAFAMPGEAPGLLNKNICAVLAERLTGEITVRQKPSRNEKVGTISGTVDANRCCAGSGVPPQPS